MNKILVFGFPHVGTSILRKLIGNCSNVYDVSSEMLYVKECDLKKAMLENKNNIVIKFPGGLPKLSTDFYKTSHEDYKIIIIIKNPYDVFGSFIKRFGRISQEYHTIDDWIKHGELFVSFENNPKHNVFTVKYEELFENDFQKIKEIFEFLNLAYSKEEIIFSKRKAFVTHNHNIPDTKPARDSHTMFRTWQMNQKFTNKTGESSQFLSNEIKEKLKNLLITKKLKY